MARLSLVGLGISDEKGISLLGSDRIRGADIIFAELFTSILVEGSLPRLEAMAGKGIKVIGRREVEDQDLVIGALSEHEEVCLLTAGDPLTATTHQELRLRAMKLGHRVDVLHSASIFTAAPGAAGLQHYKFGRTTTIPFPEGDYLPTSPLEIMIENIERGLHTLVLLDIQADNDRYMTCSQACQTILRMTRKLDNECVDETTMVVGIARAGRDDVKVAYGTMEEIIGSDMGDPPHCLIIPGRLHFMEEEVLDLFRIKMKEQG
jgi:diphthine synthase